MYNVCFDLSAAAQQSAGISRYETQLAHALLNLDGPEHFGFFCVNPDAANPTGRLDATLTQLSHKAIVTSNKAWRLKSLLWHLARRTRDNLVIPESLPRPRIFHGMDYIAPPLKTPSVITVHDLSFLLFPQFHSPYNRLYLRLALPFSLTKASRILADSEQTGKDLINRYGSKISERLRVVPLGLSDESYFQDLPLPEIQQGLAKYNLDYRSFILTVGTIEPRKNQVRLVTAFAELLKNWNGPENTKPSLVLVGKSGWQGEYERLNAEAAKHGLNVQENSPRTAHGQILMLTKVEDDELKTLYQGAALTCYVSLYEGFGLPALEAMASGSPLISADNSSLPEVVGEAALLIDATDTNQLARNMQTLLTNQALAEKLRISGRQRAKQFTWQRTAELTRQTYQEIAPS